MTDKIKLDADSFKPSFQGWGDVSHYHRIRAQAKAQEVIDQRDRYVLEALTEKGPGWACGYHLKTEWNYESTMVTMKWEFHLVELVDGQIPIGHAGFHYVTLKEPK